MFQINTVNVEGYNGISEWEHTTPNPRLSIARPKRTKAATICQDDRDYPSEEKRSKEYEFVDAPAWRICVEPSTYQYVPNNGRYRASKLVKRIESQRHVKRLQYQQETRMTPERQHLQREIQRELRKEFEMYLKLEKDKQSANNESDKAESQLNTHRTEVDQSDSDIDRYEAREWREGRKTAIQEPSSVLKVSHNAVHNKATQMKRERTKIFPAIDLSGRSMNGDQFLQEVSARLLSWERERKREQLKAELQNYAEDNNPPSVVHTHRSRSEPPTISELVDRHQNRTAIYSQLSSGHRDNSSSIPSNITSATLSIQGNREEQLRYRLPKQKTGGGDTFMKEQIARLRLSQNSAPNERIVAEFRAEPTSIALSSDPPMMSKLPPRGESLPIRVPAHALNSSSSSSQQQQSNSNNISSNQVPRRTEAVSDTTFSVRRIASTSNISELKTTNSASYHADNDKPDIRKASWDSNDLTIDSVSKSQQHLAAPSQQPHKSRSVPGISGNGASNQASSVSIPSGSPLQSMAVVNHMHYTPIEASSHSDTIIVPKSKTSDIYDSFLQEQDSSHNREKPSYTGNSPRDVIIKGDVLASQLQMLVTSTKINNPTKSRKLGLKARNHMTPSSNRATIVPNEKIRKEKSKKSEDMDLNSEEMTIGLTGKKIGYNETSQRII